MSFENKVVIVTGSTNGIGRAAAVEFAHVGAKVVLTGRSEQALKDAIVECLAAGAERDSILAMTGDISEDKFLQKLIDETIATFGQLDVLVNNAGAVFVDGDKKGFDQSIDTFDKIYKVNLRSNIYLTQLAFPHLQKTCGSVVNISSILGLPYFACTAMPYYGTVKAAMDKMTRSMAFEYIQKGVRVNVISPGLIRTPFFTKLGIEGDKVTKMEEYVASKPYWIPVGRVGVTDDIVHSILFLADNSKSSFIVGQNLVVCGGASLCNGMDTSDWTTPLA